MSEVACIGSANMLRDGTLILNLRAEGLHGEVGDAQLTYLPSDPKYDQIIRHLGGLLPGESKPVPAWKDGR